MAMIKILNRYRLSIFTVACLTYQMLDGPEMKLRSDNWNQYKTNCKYAIGELNDFIANYKWGGHASENIFGPDADQQVVSGIGLGLRYDESAC